ncbi:AAA family ATPase [Geitlerinema sp. PCC 7407]|uniref:AAA family ATPase n=1 Tax=Geitlerinema sp. PCC 7407 TaxID=1173025 RepID=UPI00059D166F|nr:AAA family ATPase [Geitlerinema sp. PCC 7407]
MIGLPGSGKSTMAERLAIAIPGSLVVSTDQIRGDLFGDAAVQGPWPVLWREVERRLRQAAIASQRSAIAAIYDATNAKRQDRRAAIALARSVGFGSVIGVWVPTPLPQCLWRNQQRDRQVPPEIVVRMHRQLVGAPPELADGLDGLLVSCDPDWVARSLVGR